MSTNIDSTIDMIVSRSDVWLVDFSGAAGSEQQGLRPAIVCSNPICNKWSPVVTIVPLTTKLKKKLPTQVELNAVAHGLDADSVAQAEQTRVIDKGRLILKLSYIDEQTMKLIDKAVAIQMGLQLNEGVYS
ncbi:type II toxin-antitoxin system PemK/MazF family toxin [Paenibacillus filicis]|uniref:mRNA interferase n=1 Tax=Paenibacillus gyeongsangnamensis TaxID=3388067 RepID=A0ABT4Q6H1_9BACL|nr:type II toxin-antitoxin system PemK/MazF family toxin [Paenibacillus filicis]MCZ8512431.1 type II toxin-antitoxin system PemK/MazF family toxin [Paenibacillus filicis]